MEGKKSSKPISIMSIWRESMNRVVAVRGSPAENGPGSYHPLAGTTAPIDTYSEKDRERATVRSYVVVPHPI